jgi:hypothetical protein
LRRSSPLARLGPAAFIQLSSQSNRCSAGLGGATVNNGGYFPKIVVARPGWLADPRPRQICSVSDCISSGPDDWIDRWLHNWLGWFNTIADAWSVVPAPDVARYRLFAYRLAPMFYRQGRPEPVDVPVDVHPEPIPAAFRSLGFDAFSKSSLGILGFECSPLSCNSMASEFVVNQYCLLPTAEEAHSAAKRFSVEQPEPGDYYLAEVLEAERAAEQGDEADER